MPTDKPPSENIDPTREMISEDQVFWSQQFLKHLELSLLDCIAKLPKHAALEDYQAATFQAVLETLRDSGMEIGRLPELAAQAMARIEGGDGNRNKLPWNNSMNGRRMELIDKFIQETITIPEQFELADLTQAMREFLDTESPMPIDGAKALHQKLLSIQRGTRRD